MKQPLVSIIVPCYNVERYIKQTYCSIASQTYDNIEIIFVDDGSTDNTSNLLKQFCKENNKCKFVTQKNSGPSAARNNGFIHSKGELIYFCDSDDMMDPATIETLVKVMCDKSVDLCCCQFAKINESLTNVKTKSQKIVFDKYLIGYENIASYMLHNWRYNFMLWNKLYKRSVIEKSFDKNNIFNTSIHNTEDVIFFLTYVKNINTAVCIKNKLYLYRIRQNSLVREKISNKKLSYVNNIKYVENILGLFTNAGSVIHMQICETTKAWCKEMIRINWNSSDISNCFNLYKKHYSNCFNKVVPWYKRFNLKLGNKIFVRKMNKYLKK